MKLKKNFVGCKAFESDRDGLSILIRLLLLLASDLFLIIVIRWCVRDGTSLCAEGEKRERTKQAAKKHQTFVDSVFEFILFLIFGSDCRTEMLTLLVFISGNLWIYTSVFASHRVTCFVLKKDKKGVKISKSSAKNTREFSSAPGRETENQTFSFSR